MDLTIILDYIIISIIASLTVNSFLRNYAKKYKILLATKPYLLDEKTDWNIKFDDEEDYDEEDLMEIVLDAGAEDIINEEENILPLFSKMLSN